MKFCPNCGWENPDEAILCCNEKCGFQFGFAAPPVDELAAEPEDDGFDVEPGPDEDQQQHENRREQAAGGGEANQTSDTVTILNEELDRIRMTGDLTIGVIGFATSGKTFFIARLKEFLARKSEYKAKPKRFDDGTVVEGTFNIEPHHFEAQPTPAGRLRRLRTGAKLEDFYIIDIPGEQFRASVQASLQGAMAEVLLKVLSLSHALVIVLPADEVFARLPTEEEWDRYEILEERFEALKASIENRTSGLETRALSEEQQRSEKLALRAEQQQISQVKKQLELLSHVPAQRRLSHLLTEISSISANARDLHERPELRGEFAEKLKVEGSAPAEVSNARWSPPAFVALAKADLLIGRGKPKTRKRPAQARAGDGQQVRRPNKSCKPDEDADPYPHIHAPAALDIDPASAFRIHRHELHERIAECFPWHKYDFVTCFKGQRPNDVKIHYRLKDYGVGEVVDWINWVRDFSLRTGRRKAGTPSPHAQRFFHAFAIGIALWLVGLDPWASAVVGLALFGLFELLADRLSVVRWLGRLREEAAITQPGKLGFNVRRGGRRQSDLDVASEFNVRNDDSTGAKTLRAIAAFVEKLLGERSTPQSRLRRLVPRVGGVAVLLGLWILAAAWLVRGFGNIEPSPNGYPLELRPVYAAEIRRMESDEPLFGQGIEQPAVERWLAIPADGGWFHIPDRRTVSTLKQAIDLLPVRAEPGRLDANSARRARALLTDAAERDPTDSRSINNYHQGLIALLSGEPAAAAVAFEGAAREIQARIGTNPGRTLEAQRRYDETTYRLHAARVSALYALGIAEMRRERWTEAVNALELAEDTARAQADHRLRPTAERDKFWFTVTPRTPRESEPMLRVSLADVWTNLLAARIRQHAEAVAAASSGAPEAIQIEEEVRSRLEARVIQAADYRSEAAGHPRLAANLIVAAARTGATRQGSEDGVEPLLSTFYIEAAPNRQIDRLGRYSAVLANAAEADHASAPFWETVQNWRRAISGAGRERQPASVLIDRTAQAERREAAGWLCNVLETEYRDASAAERRQITRNYGQYYCGSQQRRFWDAASPFGFWPGLVLAFLLALEALAAALWLRRTRSVYRRLFIPKHRADRLKPAR